MPVHGSGQTTTTTTTSKTTTLALHADMCGRTACTLAPDDLCKSCQYTDKKGRQQKPAWKDAPNGKSYYPSYNIAPGAYTPVLLSSSHFSEGVSSTRVIQPMQWGLIPSWHKGAAGDKSYETNNCRAESMLEKMTYKVPLQKGRRCVVLAEGFFEWKREKESKQPYFIYFPQNTNNSKEYEKKGDEVSEDRLKVKVEVKDEEDVKVKVEVKNEEEVKVKVEVKDENIDCNLGVGSDLMKEKMSKSNDTDSSQYSRLLTMAGVFDVWTPPGESSPVYSYSVITVESSEAMSWIHHRMPAILTSDDEIEDWLNFGEVSLNKAAKLIRAVRCIESHPVSSVVNNSRNKTPDCVKKIDLSKPKTAPGSAFMSAWLKGGQKVKVEGLSNKKDSHSGSVENKLVKQKSAGNNMMSSWLNRGQKVKVEGHQVKREGDFEDDDLQSPDKRTKIT